MRRIVGSNHERHEDPLGPGGMNNPPGQSSTVLLTFLVGRFSV
jgi:hypothetical protein